jgi:hypothetical protein
LHLHVTHYNGTESSGIDIEAPSRACLSFSDRVLIKCRVQECPSCMRAYCCLALLPGPARGVFLQQGLCSSPSCIYFFQHGCLSLSSSSDLRLSLASTEQRPLGQVANIFYASCSHPSFFRRRSSKRSITSLFIDLNLCSFSR